MIRHLFLVVVCTAGIASIAFAELEGIAFSISKVGSSGQCRQIFDYTEEEFAAFTSLRVEARAEIEDVYKTMRQELRSVVDEPTNQAWTAKHGPLIRQINYDLWQRATKILKTEDRIEKYHSMVLQEYLRSGRDVRCIASLLGKELTWKQFESLKEKIANNLVKVENALSERRREIEEQSLEPFIKPVAFRKARGKEFQWSSKPPEFDDVRFGPFEELAGQDDKMLIQVAAHEDVLDELKANLESRKTIAKLLSEFAPDDRSGIGVFRLFAGAKTEEERQAIQQEIVAQNKESAQKLTQSVRSLLSEDQLKRLQEIVLQHQLRNMDYVALVKNQYGADVDDVTRRKLETASQETRQEMEYAKKQTTIDMNAKSFDEVLGTNLATSLGKLINTTGMGMNPFGEPVDFAPLRNRYGNEATTDLPIPTSLTTTPKERIEWNEVQVPDGWKLDDAMASLEKSKKAIEQIVEGGQKWSKERDELRDAMMAAQRNGDRDLAKSLRTEYSRDYGGPGMFEMRRQFREAHKIAKEDLIKAHRIVKKLGGDPGQLTDRSPSFF